MNQPAAFSFAMFALLAAQAAPAAKKIVAPFAVQDLVRLQRISDVAAGPRTGLVAYTLRSTDMDANKGRKDVWILDTQTRGAPPRQLTSDPANDESPEWSADGSEIYFLSSRGKSTQVWRAPAAGGTAVQVTDLPVDVGSFRLAPRGDRLLVSLAVFLDCVDLACTQARLVAQEHAPSSGILHERIFVRHWGDWSDGRRSQLFSIALGATGLPSGAPVRLSQGLDADIPSKPFGGREEYAFSPDGETVVFQARVAAGGEPWSTNFDVYAVAAAGGAPHNLTASNLAWDGLPSFSPDGSTIAYVAMDRAGFESDRFHLELMDANGANKRSLTGKWDRSIEHFGWSPDGKHLIATTEHLGQHPLWSIDASSGRATAITGLGSVGDFSVGVNRVFYCAMNLASPPDLYSVGFAGGAAKRLSFVNQALLSERRMGEYEQFSFPGATGDSVFAYLVKPAGFQRGQKYPLAFLVHGGPQGSLANTWNFRWNAQNFAGAGYAVLMVDFHGSTGYGQAFTDSISGDWGGKPLEDLKKGLDATLQRYPWIDSSRMCALGPSFGGYMMNWIAGQWPDRFRCIVSHAGIFDNRSMYYSTEELWFPEWEFGGPEFANPAAYAKHNPVDYVQNWKTPTLVIHGALDYRVPYTQGLSVFTALQRRGVPSEMLFFPDENHWILKPQNSIKWYDTVLAWLDRWTKP